LNIISVIRHDVHFKKMPKGNVNEDG
jgi:hypothetical protein